MSHSFFQQQTRVPSEQRLRGLFSLMDSSDMSRNITSALDSAANILPFTQFTDIYQKIMRALIAKAEVETPGVRREYITTLKKLQSKFNGSPELAIRILLLQISAEPANSTQFAILLGKIKHMVINTRWEYLLIRVFLAEAKACLEQGDQVGAQKTFRKCVQFGQNCIIDYLNDSKQTRKEIVDQTVVLYFEMYKLYRQRKTALAQDSILKAYHTAVVNYGSQGTIALQLKKFCNQQEQSQKQVSQKSITQLGEFDCRKNQTVVASYCWETQQLMVEMLKGRQVIGHSSYQIEIERSKLKVLQDNIFSWISVTSSAALINEGEVIRLVEMGVRTSPRLQLKSVSKQDIFKKEVISSSSDDSEFFEKEEFKFLAKVGRSESSHRRKTGEE